MPAYTFTGGDARDYFPKHIGHVEPGETREFDEAPPNDGFWIPAAPKKTKTSDGPVGPVEKD